MSKTEIKRILIVFGTRPEAIKMVPVILELKKHTNLFDVVVCVTGQHKEMLYSVLDCFGITPHIDLHIMRKDQDLSDITSEILLGLRGVLRTEEPDIVLVHGDTTTSFAASLSAFYHKIPVGHVEAGLRSYDIFSPWPEEANRRLTSQLAALHFCPTVLNAENLSKENVSEEKIYITGNTVIDSLAIVCNLLDTDTNFLNSCRNSLKISGISSEMVDFWASNERKLILVTVHRRESFGDGLRNIFEAIKELAIRNPLVDFVYPVHLNPNVRQSIGHIFQYDFHLNRFRESDYPKNVYLIEPLDYFPFVSLMRLSYILLTDSGGIQEEAPSFGKPVFVLRNTTERTEAVTSGTAKLLGTNREVIIHEVEDILNHEWKYSEYSSKVNPYGNGTASKSIVNAIIEYFK